MNWLHLLILIITFLQAQVKEWSSYNLKFNFVHKHSHMSFEKLVLSLYRLHVTRTSSRDYCVLSSRTLFRISLQFLQFHIRSNSSDVQVGQVMVLNRNVGKLERKSLRPSLSYTAISQGGWGELPWCIQYLHHVSITVKIVLDHYIALNLSIFWSPSLSPLLLQVLRWYCWILL